MVVNFAVQLLEDLMSDFVFVLVTPFSSAYFIFLVFRTCKVVVRDLDLVSTCILGLMTCIKQGCRRVRLTASPSESDWRWVFDRRVMRHQNFFIEMCSNLALISI